MKLFSLSGEILMVRFVMIKKFGGKKIAVSQLIAILNWSLTRTRLTMSLRKNVVGRGD